jgi:hypothetical protein
VKQIVNKKCASCWSFSQMCVTMHGPDNVQRCSNVTYMNVSFKTAYVTLLTSVRSAKCVKPVSGIWCSFALQIIRADANKATRENIVNILVVEISVKLNDITSRTKPLQQYFFPARHRDCIYI